MAILTDTDFLGGELDDLLSELVDNVEDYGIPYRNDVRSIEYHIQENLEEIRGLNVNIGTCIRVAQLLDPADTDLKIGQGENFVGDLYFKILYQGMILFDKPVE